MSRIMLSKVYVVGLLITLNSRISLRKVLKGDTDGSGNGVSPSRV